MVWQRLCVLDWYSNRVWIDHFWTVACINDCAAVFYWAWICSSWLERQFFNFDVSLIRILSYFCRAFFLCLTMTWLPLLVCPGDWLCVAFCYDICWFDVGAWSSWLSSFTDEVTQCDEGCWSKRNGAIDQVAVLSVLLLSAKSLSCNPLFSSYEAFGKWFLRVISISIIDLRRILSLCG